MAKKLVNTEVKTEKVAKKVKPETKLKKLIPSYKENKSLLDKIKKVADQENLEIKEIMIEAGIEEFAVGDIKASCGKTEKMSFIQDSLIEKIKELKVEGIIKLVETVDYEALENAIYNEKINPESLADCQEVKTSYTLRLGKVKKDGK